MKNFIKLTFMTFAFLLIFPQFVNASEITSEVSDFSDQNTLNDISKLHAFYPANAVFSEEMGKYIDAVDSVSFAWSRLYYDDLETLSITKGEHDNTMFYYPDDFIKPIQDAKNKGKSIQLSIFADEYNVERILPFEEKRRKAIECIIKTIKQRIGNEPILFDGVVVDFEGLRNTDNNGNKLIFNGESISTYYNTFLIELNTELKQFDKKLYVAVNPRVYYDGYDYKEIIKVADQVILMAHDYEPLGILQKNDIEQYTGYNSLEPIDGLAPIHNVKQALEDIKQDIGNSEMSKIWLQIAFDSAQWQFDCVSQEQWDRMDGSTLSKGPKQCPTYAMIKNRIENKDGYGKNITYGYNKELGSPYINYFNTSNNTYNVILYEDSLSIKAKVDLAKGYRLGGISFWSLGNIPDFSDDNGKEYHLDVWDNLTNSTKAPIQTNSSGAVSITFEDKVIEEIVRKKIGKPTGSIMRSDVEGIHRLKLTGAITKISDLKFLNNLEYLDASNTGISDIAPLSSLEELRVLYLQRNSITNITPIGTLNKLEILSLNGNNITDINPLSNLKYLRELYVSENNIEDVAPLSSLNELRKLYCSSNTISNIIPLNNLIKLDELNLENNSIENVDSIGSLSQLRYLNIGVNKVSSIESIKNLHNLEFLYLQRNFLENISALKGFNNLQELSLNGNKITSVSSISHLFKLKKLYLRDNKITDISGLKELSALQILFLGGNNIINFNPILENYDKLTERDFLIDR